MPTFGATFTGLVDNETSVGVYTIECSGAAAENYVIAYETGTLTTGAITLENRRDAPGCIARVMLPLQRD